MNFTTTAIAKRWLNLKSDDDNDILDRLCLSATAYVRGWINRDIILTSYSDTLNGNGHQRIILPNFPIVSVQALTIEDTIVPAKNGSGSIGYTFGPYLIYLTGYRFAKGNANISIQYTAGYTTGEAFRIPSTAPYTYQAMQLWAADQIVTVAGIQLTPSDLPPGPGQYNVTDGLYTFNAAEKGLMAIISYGYVPADIVQATTELVGRKYRERDRIGLASKAMAGETTAYSQSDLSADTKAILNQYRQVAIQ